MTFTFSIDEKEKIRTVTVRLTVKTELRPIYLSTYVMPNNKANSGKLKMFAMLFLMNT